LSITKRRANWRYTVFRDATCFGSVGIHEIVVKYRSKGGSSHDPHSSQAGIRDAVLAGAQAADRADGRDHDRGATASGQRRILCRAWASSGKGGSIRGPKSDLSKVAQ